MTLKVLLCPPPPNMSSLLFRALKWGTVWSFISKGIKVTRRQSQRFQKRPVLLSKFGKSKVWLFVVLMPLEVKLHTVPHFKALNSGKDIHSRQGYGCTFICTRLLWKVPILLHTEQIGRVFIGASVFGSYDQSGLKTPTNQKHVVFYGKIILL